jgi:phosphoribosylamine-glycine ligase
LGGAIEKAYEAAQKIRFDGMHYRTDIGSKGLERYNIGVPGT